MEVNLVNLKGVGRCGTRHASGVHSDDDGGSSPCVENSWSVSLGSAFPWTGGMTSMKPGRKLPSTGLVIVMSDVVTPDSSSWLIPELSLKMITQIHGLKISVCFVWFRGFQKIQQSSFMRFQGWKQNLVRVCVTSSKEAQVKATTHAPVLKL